MTTPPPPPAEHTPLAKPPLDLAAALLRVVTGRGPWMRMAEAPIDAQCMYIYVHYIDAEDGEDLVETDALVAFNEQHVEVYRTNTASKHVWRAAGSLLQATRLLHDLPAPGTPGAPVQELNPEPATDQPL